ncbi:MAG: Zn-ribbon domain-containing OB-fold protein [Archaeoglobaceae archaeon]|nr:Zn-ribbon domain-containing OB-fold protein [Archaeoglobaceae archaeon]MDW7989865.1 Zn-ribbon domain-containing OB-fold protein [Archaeoglobaceae archaeon]
MIDKIVDPEKLRHFPPGGGKIELYWLYTSGKAGNEFFRKLREGKFIAARCKKCGRRYFPPRIFCEFDFSETEFFEISGEGCVEAFTIAKLDLNENPMEEIIALIKLEGTDGRILHLIGEAKDVCIGMKVKPVLKKVDEMTGTISDIKYFKPV